MHTGGIINAGNIYLGYSKDRGGTVTSVESYAHSGSGEALPNMVPKSLRTRLGTIKGCCILGKVVVSSTRNGKSTVGVVDCHDEGLRTLAEFDTTVTGFTAIGANTYHAARDGGTGSTNTSAMIDDRMARCIKEMSDGGCVTRFALSGDDNMYMRYNSDTFSLEVVNTVKDKVTIVEVDVFKTRKGIAKHVVAIDVMQGVDHIYISISATDYKSSAIAVLMLDHDYQVKRQWCCNDMQLSSMIVSYVKFFTYQTSDVFLMCLGHGVNGSSVAKEWSMQDAIEGGKFMGSGAVVYPDTGESIVAIDRSHGIHNVGMVKYKTGSRNCCTTRIGMMG
jgi:hypothetical protein